MILCFGMLHLRENSAISSCVPQTLPHRLLVRLAACAALLSVCFVLGECLCALRRILVWHLQIVLLQNCSQLLMVLRRTEATAIAAGYMHVCAVVTPGDVYCWGYNKYGQLGSGGIDSNFNPLAARVEGLREGDVRDVQP